LNNFFYILFNKKENIVHKQNLQSLEAVEESNIKFCSYV